MAIFGAVGGVILLCMIAALWSTGTMSSRRFNFHGKNRSIDRREPKPRAPGLD